MAANDYAREVADRVIEALQQGTAPWQKPWAPGTLRAPFNPTTGKPYRGMNSMWLALQGYSDPRWMTYKQADAEGAQVKKGSKGTRIEYWKFHDEQEKRDETGRPVRDEEGRPLRVRVELDRPRRFTAVVFNAEQIDGLAPLAATTPRPEPERHARAEAVLANSGARIRHVTGDRAYYSPSTDSITLPERNQFKGPDAFYATALHELGHWSGHPSRLDRDLAHPFGSEGYAKEELRAEIGSLMLGEQLEIGHDPGQHVAYVKSWIKALQDDPREIFRAASDAEKITKMVMGFEQQQEQTQEQTAAQEAEQQAAPQQSAPEEQMTQERTYLAVPYSEKNEAKKLGARWDREAKSWYAPEGTRLQTSGLARWLPKGAQPAARPEAAPPEQVFGDELRRAGLRLDGAPVMDGKLHRVPVEGDQGSERSGAYVGHLDGQIPAGFIQNYKSGEAANWRYPSDAVAALTDEERAEAQAAAAANRQRREAEKVEAQQRASEAAVALWTEADPASESNPYCRAKDILDPDVKGLRTVPDSVLEAAHGAGIRIAHSGKDAQTMREAEPDAWVFQRGDLLVPLYNEQAEVVGVQAVNPAFKGFMRGGRKAGLYSIAGGTPEDLKTAFDFDPNLPILVCEGYATGDTIAEAVGHPVVVGLDSGNLDAVARQMRETYPERALVIAADNDPKMVNGRPRNVGVEKATAAAKAHGGGVIVPKFGEGAKGTDWNDYASEQGHQEAAKTIREEVERAKIEASITASKMRYYAHERMADAQDNPATAADNQFVADQRSKAAESINEATEQESAVQADAVNAATTPGAAQADMSSIAVRNQTMKDEVKTQRIEVLDGTTNSPQEDPGVQQNLRDEQQQRRAFKRSRGRGR